MRALFLVSGLIMLFVLLAFAVQNASSMTAATFILFGGQPISTISMVPIIVGGVIGILTGFFLATFAMTKQKNDEAEDQNW